MSWLAAIRGSGGNPPAIPPLSAIPAGCRILFAGDSITQGWRQPPGTVDATYRWCAPFEAQLTSEFTAAGKTVPTFLNSAVSGQVSAALLAGINAQIIDQTPDRVFLQIGTNDTAAFAYETLRDNIKNIISTTRASLPTCLFYVISLWMNGENWPKGTNAGDGVFDIANAAIYDGLRPTLGTASQWIYVRDAAFAWEAIYNSGHAASGYLTQDGAHPSKQGTGLGPISGAELISQQVRAAVTLATR